MSPTDALLSAGQYFLTITAELIVFFLIVSLLVGVLNVYVSRERMQKILGKTGSVIGSVAGAVLAMMLIIFGPQVTGVYAGLMFAFAVVIGLVLEKAGYRRYVKNVVVEGEVTRTGTKAQQVVRFAVTLFRQMVPYLLLGAAIGAFIYGFLPSEWVLAVAGPENIFAIPVAAAIGIFPSTSVRRPSSR